MAKRNRAKEVARFGAVVGSIEAAELAESKAFRAEVSPQDKADFALLAVWAHRYGNWLCDVGGFNNERVEKLGHKAIVISSSTFGDKSRITKGVRAYIYSQPNVEYGSYDQRAEYRRQLQQGMLLDVSVRKETDDGVSEERLELVMDADESLLNGGYRMWDSPHDHSVRLAPDAKFNSFEEAHIATVTARCTYLLGEFSALIQNPPERVHRDRITYGFNLTPPDNVLPRVVL